MKIIYFVTVDLQSSSGVAKKINSQVNALRDLGANVEIITVYPHANIVLSRTVSALYNDYTMNKKLRHVISKLSENDIIYMRFPYPSYAFFKTVTGNRTCKIVTEHQTIEIQEQLLKKHHIYVLMELLFGKRIRESIDAFVGVTEDYTVHQLNRIKDYKKPHITIGNGIDVDTVKIRNPPRFTRQSMELLSVANMSSWHGLERVIMGLKAYSGGTDARLHLVGDGGERDKLIRLTHDLDVRDKVIFHGFKSGRSLDEMFDMCHLAIGSLGLHKLKTKQSSSLKSKEYCSRGIPFVEEITDLDFTQNFPYIFEVPADDSPVDIEALIAFCDHIYQDDLHHHKMREYAKRNLEWKIKMNELKNFLSGL